MGIATQAPLVDSSKSQLGFCGEYQEPRPPHSDIFNQIKLGLKWGIRFFVCAESLSHGLRNGMLEIQNGLRIYEENNPSSGDLGCSFLY